MRLFTIFKDPTKGMINQRIATRMTEIAHQFTELDQDQLVQFDDMLLRISWKLVATWTHLDRYTKLEDQLITAANETGPINAQRIQKLDYSQDLFLEIDEFLVQLKSTLDHLVKIPKAIFGEKRWNLTTFGSKGKDVANALLRNIPKGDKERAKSIKELLIDRYSPWLIAVIERRDASNHFIHGGLNMDGLMVFRQIVEGEDKLHVPMWDDRLTVREVLETSWINLLTFTEDFIACFLSFKIFNELSMLHDKVDPKGSKSPWIILMQEDLDRALSNRKPDQLIIVPRPVLFTPKLQQPKAPTPVAISPTVIPRRK